MKKVIRSAGITGVVSGFMLLIVCMIALVFITRSMKEDGRIMTFEQCAALRDSHIQESYPEVCVTKAGQQFVNNAQKHQCGRIEWTTRPAECY